jgi:transcriptional regulator with GAF, ATPase, and Fis domain
MQQTSSTPEPSAELRLSALEKLLELTVALNHSDDPAEIVALIPKRAAELLQAEHAFLYMLNPKTRETMLTLNRYSRHAMDTNFKEIEINASGWIMRFQKSLLSADMADDDRFRGLDLQKDVHPSVIGIPLTSARIVLGSLVLVNKSDTTAFGRNDLELLEKLGQVVTPFMHNTQPYQYFFDKPMSEAILLEKYAKLGLLGKSEKFIQLVKSIEAAAACDVRVLLQGASGTGKELVARAIHRMSARWKGPFLAIDCGAIPPGLVESELMGHVKGAFTGASMDRKGLIDAADAGTLFMDEVANLPMDVQSKLLRVLQEGEIRPLGSNKIHKVDVRIIAAAGSSLEKQVQRGQFREDLFYRLFIFPITVPSLKEREEDIGLLANHFLRQIAGKQHKKLQVFHSELVDYFKHCQWPGNIRELENVVERLVALAPGDITVLCKSHLPIEMRKQIKPRPRTEENWNVEQSLSERVQAYETLLICQALEENGWNQSRAARALKMPVQTLHNKIEKMKLDRKIP